MEMYLLIILAVLQAGTTGVLIAILRQRSIEKTLAQVDANTEALENALNKHRSSINKLPADIHNTFSKEVREGLEPLMKSVILLKEQTVDAFNKKAFALEENNRKFHALLSHVADLDKMPSWLSKIEDSIQPLVVVSNEIIQVQKDNRAIFDSTSSLIKDYGEKGDKVLESYMNLKNIIDEWANEERISRIKFSETVDDHLKEFNKLNASIKMNLEKLIEVEKT